MSKPTLLNNYIYGWNSTVAPAAGAAVALNMLINRLSELCYIHFDFTTAAGGPNRYVRLEHQISGPVQLDWCGPAVAQAGGLTWRYVGSTNGVQTQFSTYAYFRLPDHPFFYRGAAGDDVCNIFADGIQPADQISLIYACWKFWPIKP